MGADPNELTLAEQRRLAALDFAIMVETATGAVTCQRVVKTAEAFEAFLRGDGDLPPALSGRLAAA